MQQPLDKIPMRTLNRPERSAHLRKADDGALYLSCGIDYERYFESLVDYLERAVQLRPDTTFLAQRDLVGQWRKLTYADVWRDACAVATWLIGHGFGPGGAPIMILSENSIEHALLTLGALRAGAAVAPVSPTFSLGNDFSRLGYAIELTEPGLVFALDEERYGPALAFAGKHADAKGDRRTIGGEQFKRMLAERNEALVLKQRALIKSETIAKILLTSGSTGRPKGVVNTHGNLAAAVQMIRQVSEPYDPERIHTIVDWLPWHHTFGGNAQFNGVIAAAGTLYIDDGRPLPGQFKVTIENLREISPTGFSCVPAAYTMLAEALENDADLRQRFFKNLRWLSYGGALLPQPLWERMQRLAATELGERLPFGTGWGMTETSATGVGIYWNTNRTGFVGLPQPGVELKLVPAGDRLELRIKGPHITPGYFRAPELNAQAFDAEGFFKTGDAVRWVDPNNYLEGLEFAGRLAEDFKLLSGTWVQASIVRRDLVEGLAPLVADAVITGADKDYLGAMVWLVAPEAEDTRAALKEKLAAFNSKRQGSANVIERILILNDPPSPAASEITDKGSINQRRVLERRVADVATLYAEPVDTKAIVRTK